jgi:hypothetical protein
MVSRGSDKELEKKSSALKEQGIRSSKIKQTSGMVCVDGS